MESSWEATTVLPSSSSGGVMVVSSLFCPQVVVIIKIRINLKTCCILATDPDGWPGFDISSTNKMQLDNRKEVKKGQEIEDGGNYR